MGGKSAALIILGIVAVACLAYAGVQFWRGEPEDAPPLVIGAVVCGTLIAVMSRKAKE
ncbi:MAG: hypothetical protein R3C13_06875 [Hyphomonas sp.]|uniref:hypothetical protein n=1 Tax=Hyphomonas sp. TaxID=87 RepID=UPI0035285B3E